MIELTAHLVAAYLEKNRVPIGSVSDLISSVSGALHALGRAPVEPEEVNPLPAVNPQESVFPDYIICLDDGKKFKSLKRHLSTLGMSPDEYRTKWRLPADYPMVAPGYSARRSALAIKLGLGRKSKSSRRPSKVKRQGKKA